MERNCLTNAAGRGRTRSWSQGGLFGVFWFIMTFTTADLAAVVVGWLRCQRGGSWWWESIKGNISVKNVHMRHLAEHSYLGRLKRHIGEFHDKMKNHVCETCGSCFSQKSYLNRHIQHIHEEILNHECGECGYSFLSHLVMISLGNSMLKIQQKASIVAPYVLASSEPMRVDQSRLLAASSSVCDGARLPWIRLRYK